MKITHDDSGRSQEMACLPMDQVPRWLTTIHASKGKGKAELKAKIREPQIASFIEDIMGMVREDERQQGLAETRVRQGSQQILDAVGGRPKRP